MKAQIVSAAPLEDPAAHRGEAQRPMLAGIPVREEDIEPQKGLHFVAYLFRGLSVLLLLLMVVQVVLGLGNPAPGALGLLMGEAVRLLVFAGLLWGAGDLAMLQVKSHHEMRAARILLARQTYMMRRMAEAAGELPAPERLHRQTDDEPA